MNPTVQHVTKAKMKRLSDAQGVPFGVVLDRVFAEMEIGPDGVPSGVPEGWATKYPKTKSDQTDRLEFDDPEP